MTDWLSMNAADLGRGIGAGEIDPVALTEAYLSAIDAHPARDRIYSAVTHDRARAEAAAAADRARAGYRLGPLDGVPISWKDLFDSAGVETASGTALLAGRHSGPGCACSAQCHDGGAGLSGQDAYERAGLFRAGIEPGNGNTALCE